MKKKFEYFNRKLVAGIENLPLQHKIFIMTTFYGGILTFVGGVAAYLSNLHYLVTLVSLLASTIFLLTLTKIRRAKNYKTYIWFFISISYMALIIIWFFNDGYHSSHIMLILLAMAVSLMLVDAKNRKYILLIYLISVLVLISIHYFYPNLIIEYNNETDRYLDFMFSAFYNMIILYFIITNLLNNYHTEQLNLKKEKEITEKYNKELVELNETISSQNVELETLINQLSDVNQMVSLQNSQLTQQNIELESLNNELSDVNYKVTYQNKLLSELNEELNNANSTKDKFFSIISHDLKNPLTAIMGSVELMQIFLNQNQNDKLPSQVEKLKKSTHQFRDLLNELLEWARAQTGALKFEPVEFNLYDLCNENIANIKSLAEIKNINVGIKSENANLTILADHNMINTIIRNLLTNAIKFTPQNGNINLNLVVDNNDVILEVADSGIGMSSDDASKLFRIDVNTHTIGNSKEKGTGLGLIICQEFIKKHNGTISVRSKLNQGSTFIVRIPKSVDFSK